MFGWQPSYRVTVSNLSVIQTNFSSVRSFGKLPQSQLPVAEHHHKQ